MPAIPCRYFDRFLYKSSCCGHKCTELILPSTPCGCMEEIQRLSPFCIHNLFMLIHKMESWMEDGSFVIDWNDLGNRHGNSSVQGKGKDVKAAEVKEEMSTTCELWRTRN